MVAGVIAENARTLVIIALCYGIVEAHSKEGGGSVAVDGIYRVLDAQCVHVRIVTKFHAYTVGRTAAIWLLFGNLPMTFSWPWYHQ